MTETIEAFMAAVREAIAADTFVRVSLGKYRGTTGIQKIVVTRVSLKDGPKLRFVTSSARKDVTDNETMETGLRRLKDQLGNTFHAATLFTTEKDVSLLFNKKREAQISQAKPTFKAAPASDHNRAKQYAVEPSRPYLAALGVSQADGTVKPSMYPKFKQICHFIEIIDDLVRDSPLREAAEISVVDIGSGKGYLTFALHDFLNDKLGKEARVTGIEVRPDMVGLCAGIADRLGLKGLSFEAAEASKASAVKADVTIALHACDTATDDAMAQGIAAGSALIICAPCCQHELAPQLAKSGAELAGLMKYGLFKQRQADLVTDAARCLLLEASGYKVKVIEFVSTEHTAKNLMIAAIRSPNVDRAAARKQYEALKAFMGFEAQHLEQRLGKMQP